MSPVLTKRMTSRMEGDYVVFLIGMRVNRWWKPWRWVPIIFQMTRMLRELGQHPELGLLGFEGWFGRTTMMLAYFRSKEHLMTFASSPSSSHVPAWRSFMRSIGTNGDVGIWHETYAASPGTYENVYVNLPPFGLGKVGTLVEANGHLARARGRMEAPDATQAA